jgi:2-desacetyl-2-hydroxyethyl bacteriochlorophyllide A dehydrogenase
MRAVTFEGPFSVAVKDVPDAEIKDPTDAILRVTTSAICGSDLHVYNGRMPMPLRGWVLGHEYVGLVEEVGAAVTNFKKGERVVGAFMSSCGQCFYCNKGWTSQCMRQHHIGLAQLPGSQAEYLRVPLAATSLDKVPASLSDEQAIFVGDVMATGYFGAERGVIQEGDVVAVVGCGAVGLFAVMCAQLFKPKTIIAIDTVPERVALAEKLGAVGVDKTSQDPGRVMREHTEKRGADVVIEAVGHADSIQSCFTYVRPGGTISVVGVYSEAQFPFPMFQAFVRDLTFRIGLCPAKRYMAFLLSLIEAGKLDPAVIVSHSLPLVVAPRAYDIFAHHKENCIKALLKS